MPNKVFQITTLVDITATGVTRSTPDREVERNQQRNWETVLQVLSLRTQPHIVNWPYKVTLATEDVRYLFGAVYSGNQEAWKFEFTADHPDSYSVINGTLDEITDPISGLQSDFEQVPVITGLTETARFLLPIFYPFGAIKNIHITLLTYP
jgi:hypothetical protein